MTQADGNRTVVIGLGTGRCGTMSLAKLLDQQPGCAVTHEVEPVLAWYGPTAAGAAQRLAELLSRDAAVVGDVALYYLPYVEQLRREAEAAEVAIRFVCLRRPREAVVASFERKVSTKGRLRHHWIEHDGQRWSLDPKWDACFPKFAGVADRAEAIGRYWDLYYEQAERLAGADFRIFETEQLNAAEGVAAILDFAGIEQRRLAVGLRFNWGVEDGAVKPG